MAIGRMPEARHGEMFIAAHAVGALANPFYAARIGWLGLPPGVCFRMLGLLSRVRS